MATIRIDNRTYEVQEGQNVLQAALSLGCNLPYFCWHAALGSVGACRQCAVKQFRDENDTAGRIVMACMTPASNGAIISISDPEATAFRASVIEWLMENHPHDCPVCDEGGECHLQDMTVMTGHVYRSYRFPKRTYRNQDLGPFVNHEMNRCIQCYRCVRFYNDYAGGRDFGVFSAHDHVYFGREQDGVLESEFSGNLVEVCPTGVFTDKSLKRHYTRKWDLQTAPSICAQCGLGCNTIGGERYGELRRIRNRFNGEVNGYFLCDRGRYGYEFVNSDRRIRQPIMAGRVAEPGGDHSDGRGNGAGLTDNSDLLRSLVELLGDGSRVIGIGSPRASLEANFALRSLVGPERFYTGMSSHEARGVAAIIDVLTHGPAPAASLADVRAADAVLVLGEDVTHTAPMLALALRQSARNQPLRRADAARIPRWDDGAVRELLQGENGPLFIASVGQTRLDDIAAQTYHAAPDDLARLGFAVANALDPAAARPADLADDAAGLAATIAQALRTAEKPLIVAGAVGGSERIVQAAANVAWALIAAGRPARAGFTVPEGNSLGVGLMAAGADDLGAAFAAVRDGTADTVIILENDLYRRADADLVDAFLSTARHVIVLDTLRTPTVERAEIALPAATFAESTGTLVNNEGRAQRFYQVMIPTGAAQASWRWLRDLAVMAGRLTPGTWENIDAVSAALADALPIFRPILEIAPPASFRLTGQRIARQPARYSGRTAMHAQIDVSEPRPPDDPDSPLSFSMEGAQLVPVHGGVVRLEPPPALIPRFWAPGWNSIQALNRFQEEVGGPLAGGDPGKRLIEPGAAASAAPRYFGDLPAAFRAKADALLLVPLHHIFGSEELSVLSPGIAELSPAPYLALNPADAIRLGMQDGEQRELALGGRPRQVTISVRPDLPAGVAGLPAGLPDLTGITLPAWSKLA